MAYAIRDAISRTYYRKTTGIGPMFGGTIEEAVVFSNRQDAARHTIGWPMTVLWDLVRCSDKRLKKQRTTERW